ncbi:hypothetical protein BGW41_002775 [Actinomortierella wolfii]|nr:hypothetical protein BGW41_002775 [Actinomortierella wolfii]
MSDSGRDSTGGSNSAASSSHNSPTPAATATAATTRPGAASAGSSPSMPSSSRIGSLHHTTPSVPGGRLASLRGAHTVGAAGATRGGAAKIKFTPTVPTKRNKKDAAPSLLEEARAGTSDAGRGATGRGRGGERGRGRGGRGAGRGGRGRGEEIVATASGPFSLGPSATNRWTSRQSQLQAMAGRGGASGAHSSYTGIQKVKIEHADGDDGMTGDDREYYGDAAVDMKFGSGAADASLPTGVQVGTETARVVKREELRDGEEDTHESDILPKIEGPAQDLLPSWQEDQLFFFQFPSVVPRFKPRPLPAMMEGLQLTDPDGTAANETDPDLIKIKSEPQDNDSISLNGDGLLPVKKEEPDAPKLGTPATATTPGSSGGGPPAGQRAKPKATPGGAAGKAEEEDDASNDAPLAQEGKIGRLLVYRSGKVKMQVGDIVMDVTAGSECAFLQDLVVVDSTNKQAFVMGSVQKRMICVPNLEQLLAAVENNQADQ